MTFSKLLMLSLRNVAYTGKCEDAEKCEDTGACENMGHVET